MLIKSFEVGVGSANCYIVTDESSLECAVIDPGGDANTILDYLESNRLQCRYIFLTHGHFDHTGAINELKEETGAKFCMGEKDTDDKLLRRGLWFNAPRDTIFCHDGDEFSVGALRFKVLETPGHSPGGLCFICERALFTGDTLFRDDIGRTDFPGCSAPDMMRSLKRLYDLEGDYEVYPGHMESTTLERERRHNYFLKDFRQD
ncbi:MAG: MBL fold metallo-hydrolase [Oscillospiraceae bacterium]|jgi:glyoxylase-like metal-dependent hydrolase (beta-lactamase superfamily II)|nr:MBL fold metallo-hydrolase [Oscillospiraceae bacterium]